MKTVTKQSKIKNNRRSHAKIANLGPATTLTLGTRGGQTEGRRQNWY